jgi:hypothetical protein
VTNLVYKTGDVDSVGAVIKQNGNGMNLTGYTVRFVIKKRNTEIMHIITCTQGYNFNGTVVPGSSGGVTIPFNSTTTSIAGEFDGEFILSKVDSVIHAPSYPEYVTVSIVNSLM